MKLEDKIKEMVITIKNLSAGYSPPSNLVDICTERIMEIIERNQTPLTKDQIADLNEKHGYFQFADAQGDVTLAFVRDIEKMHGIKEAA